MTKLGEILSDREIDVLRCTAAGASNREIAQELVISPNTVKVHLRNIYAKLGATTRTEAVTLALQQGILSVGGQDEAAVVVAEPDGEEDSAESTPPTPQPVSSAQPQPEAATVTFPRHWLIGGMVLLIAFVVAVTAFAVRRPISQATPTATQAAATVADERFVEQQLGNSRWLTSQPAPDARAGMAMAGIGLNIYQIGGETSAGVTPTGAVYITNNRLWNPIADKPTAVTEAAVAVVTDQIYVVGGRNSSSQPTSLTEVYSPSSDAWRSAAALPETTSGALALAADNLLFLFGGTDGTTVRSSAWAYDPATDSWRPLPPMTHARAHAAGGVIDDVLYVVGGSDGVQDLAVCERFDPTTETWSQCPDMIEARGGAGAAVLLDSLYVIGGGLHQPVSHAEVFDADSDTWGVVNTPMLTEASDWSLLGVAAVETHVYAIGGRQNGVLTDSNFYYAPPMHYQFLPVQTGGQ